jgi:hypothetical protein
MPVRRVLSTAAAAAALWAALPTAGAAEPCALKSASGRWCVAIDAPGTPRVGVYTAWKVRVTGPDGRPAELSVAVRGGMPAHGHGLPSTPAVRRVGPGNFLVEGLLFNMPGEWVLVFDARADGAGPDPVTYTLRLDR